jgi:4-diphosphocytidyl-2-C-methyl-D-erythritol kinase
VPGPMAADGPCVSVRVPAKLNLFLAVRGARPDGYHELVTVLQTVSLYDQLRVGVFGPPGRGHHPTARRRMRLELWHEPAAGLPEAEQNLAVRAARTLGRSAGIAELGEATLAGAPELIGDEATPRTVLDLMKGIPIAGGMAGGSADAAAALLALNELWGLDHSRDSLRELAATLGSDVPFCVVGGTALATGRGTALAQVLCRGTFHWLVCPAREPLSTAEVYRAWDRTCSPSEIEPDAVLQALRNEDAEALGAGLHNDLEPAAFALRPHLAEDKEALLDAGALGTVLSGSGPTLLALVADEAAGLALAEAVGERFRDPVIARSPAGGPEVRAC